MIPVNPNDVVVFVGDSITDQGCFLPAIDSINLALTARRSGAASVASGRCRTPARGGASAATVPQRPIRPVISGTPGDRAASIAANVASRITNYNPNAVVLFVGVNDALVATNLAAFNASVDTILAGVAAYNPSTPMLVLSILEIGEQWLAGPVWNNAFDPPPSNPGFSPSIAQFNTQTQTAVNDTALTACEYVDLRATALAYEVANNVTGAANGLLTLDNVHPSQRGKNLISAVAFAAMAVA